MFRSFSLAAMTAIAAASSDFTPVSIGTFQIKNPAFVNIQQWPDSEPFLLTTAFGPFSAGYLQVVTNVAEAVQAQNLSTLSPVKLSTPSFLWPNDAITVPMDVFGERVIVVPDGFIPPGKTNGGVYLVQMDPVDVTKTVATYTMTHNTDGYFYHMGFWIDLNGDGRKDFLTAKCNTHAGEGKLVWYEHPKGGLSVENWTEHIVATGPDVGILAETFDQFPNEIVVFAAQFFDEQLAYYRVSTIDGSFKGSRLIDNTTLNAYSVQLVDLNSDGKKQLVMNNHQKETADNGIWAYTVPDDLVSGAFDKYAITTGFKNAFSVTVPNMAPGFPYVMWPETSTEGSSRAHIMIAGDGDHSVSRADPTGNASQFEYTRSVIKNEKGTVGALTFSDFDNDGWQEMWVPNYDSGYMEVFLFEPVASAEAFLQ